MISTKSNKNRNTDLRGNPSTERKITIFLFLLFSDKNTIGTRGGINRIVHRDKKGNNI